jgi:hypothetical protein
MKSDTFERLYERCQNKDFLKSNNQATIVPFYIIPYKPTEKQEVANNINMVTKRLQEVNINILRLDLFNLCIEILKDQDMLEDVLELEQDESPEYFLDAFDSAINNEVVSDYIQTKIQDNDPDVVFIQGIDKAYPFRRLHPLINILHAKTEKKPIVFFYPGIYNGIAFKLFGLEEESFKSNNYEVRNLE